VRLHGSHRHIQPCGNGLVAQTQHHLLQHVRFPYGQHLPFHPLGNAARDHGPDRDIPLMCRSQAVEEIAQAATEQQVTARTLLQRVADPCLTITMRQDHDTRNGSAGGGNQPQSGFIVRDDDIGRVRRIRRARRRGCRGATERRLEVAAFAQDGRQPERYQRIGVCHEHPDSGGWEH
jgi:hypothetical protein